MTDANIIHICRSAEKKTSSWSSLLEAGFANQAANAKPIARSGIDEKSVGKPVDGDCVAIWILYRKGSFSLKERISSAALFERRKVALEQQGATHVRMAQASESNWLRSAFELPRASI